jgi:hypothetical protein
MSRVDGTQAEDRGRTETPDVIPAEGSDKAAVAGKAVGIDGKKISGSRGPGFLFARHGGQTRPVERHRRCPDQGEDNPNRKGVIGNGGV